jgi:hypothetical protein
MSTVEETEREQLRLSLLALHRRRLLLGPRRNFFIMLALLAAGTGAAIYLLPSDSFLYLFPVIFIVPPFALHHSYFIDLPATKSVLAFFEKNHPELCSWLPESALLEAKMLYEQKAL